MLSLYIGVYKAIYDYEAQSEEELTLRADDLLYLLEKSDIDDWWKVKRREVSNGEEEVDEPQGLVPSNYIEVAPVVKTAYALYDYDKQTEEELSFKEGEKFNVYDLKDPDWLLVGDLLTQTQFGFVPSNYIELDGTSAVAAPVAAPAAPAVFSAPVSNGPLVFAPPPQHKDRTSSPKEEQPLPMTPSDQAFQTPVRLQESREQPIDLDDEAPPPMPSRPSGSGYDDSPVAGSSSNYNSGRARAQSNASSTYQDQPEHKFDGEFFTWYISEVDGRKKRGITLSVGQGLIILKPTKPASKLSLKPASSIDQEWPIRNLIDYSNEKKHLFLELKNPLLSVELHTGSKDVAEAIMSILGDIKGADSSRVLSEVANASKPSNNPKNKKIGRLLYDFEAQGDDELQCREGDEVYVIDESKSKDWWMVKNIDTGRQGVVPLTYIEIIGSSTLDKLTEQPLRKKSVNQGSKHNSNKKSTKGRIVENESKSSSSKQNRNRSRDERDMIRERDRIQRDKQEQKQKSSGSGSSSTHDKSMPNIHRVRTWIDSSGSFKVEAEFLGCIEGKIHLHKTNGVKIAVGATKLSIEDLEYVEKVTGTSLESYKEEVNKQMLKRQQKSHKQSGVSNNSNINKNNNNNSSNNNSNNGSSISATAAINNIPPPQPTRPSKSEPTTAVTEPDYDWFEFFLSCGVDIGNCQRYSLNFSREQMDENILQDISPSLLRTLGLREGDILRVMKVLDSKFNRSSSSVGNTNDISSAGRLFTEVGGELKNNNSTSEISRVDAKALPSPQKQIPDPLNSIDSNNNKFEDDAWAVKPAARSSEDLLKPQVTQTKAATPQYTGSLQDLVNIKPLESNYVAPQSATTSTQFNASSQSNGVPTAAALQPVKTGTLIQPGQQFSVQKTGGNNSIPSQITGGLVPVRTGGLIPIPSQQTGGLIPAQPTGFMPITAQPTGFMPIQQTGGLVPQLTFGVVPLQTGANTFQQQMPITTFGQPQLQQTGGFIPLQTGVFSGPPPPTTSFGQVLSVQKTGPLIPTQRTGGQPTGGMMMPQTSFGNQPTGGYIGGQVTGGQPQQQFQPQFQPQQTFSQPQFQPQPTTSFGTFGQPQQQPTTSFGQFQPQQTFNQPSFGQMPQQSFGQQPNTSFGMAPQQSFGQQPTSSFGMQQPSFGQIPQPTFGQQPNMGQMTDMFQNTSISSSQPFPQTSFGQQPQFDGFNSQPLQAQPTGAGFGNAPLQAQQTGRRANLQTATADNPFGF